MCNQTQQGGNQWSFLTEDPFDKLLVFVLRIDSAGISFSNPRKLLKEPLCL